MDDMRVWRECKAGQAPRYETELRRGAPAFSRFGWAVILRLPDREGISRVHHVEVFYGEDASVYHAARTYAARARAGRMQFTRYRNTSLPHRFGTLV